MKPLVIYHDSCTDGYGAAFAAWMKLGDEAEYVPMQYGQTTENIIWEDRDVYILDFSFPKDIMDAMLGGQECAKRVVWLDHHKTAFEMWCPDVPYEKGDYIFDDSGPHLITLDDNKSGALLAWEYFHPGTEVPMLIQHIDDRDRWQWKLRCSAEIHAALGSMQPWSFEQWEELIQPEHYGSLCTEGAAILRAQKQRVEQMAKQARKCNISIHVKGKKVRKALKTFSISPDPVFHGLAVNASIHQSEVGHELANQSGTFGCVWYVAGDNRVRCSLRSNGDYDVSSIARAFGGGGHRNAAGFETDVETLMSWLT